MNTWTCKGLVAGTALAVLAGCDDIGQIDLGGAATPAPLLTAELGRGAVTLVPPDGYCIDQRSLRASFALIARCDTLGGETGLGQPLAIITATTVAALDGQDVSPATLGANGETVLNSTTTDTLTLAQVRGTPPGPGVRDVFWRAVGTIGTQAVGFAIYEAADGPELGDDAPALLIQTMTRTQSQTAATQDKSATTPAKQSSKSGLAGLFQRNL
ncbi:hypothetical protein [uncultured Tateyamaria sp.]|uniref:hypothetical protein n=1 Tax=uncultured Tateyamaria sp. TaxID=455651 RepID=UPI00260BECED|nr:hypothetical protein [uncultured Tateyamaria sp.]